MDDSDRDIRCYGEALVRASGGTFCSAGERIQEESFPPGSIPEGSGHTRLSFAVVMAGSE